MAKIGKMTSFCHKWRHFWVNCKKFWNFKPYFSNSQKHFVKTLFWQYFDKINISLWKLAKYTENDEIYCFSLGKILRKIWSVNYHAKKKSGLWLNYVFLDLDSQMVIGNKKTTFGLAIFLWPLTHFPARGERLKKWTKICLK